jgi:IS30 family transposase
MTNYKEIIRLHANGFSIRLIAQALSCHRSTVNKCLKRAQEEDLHYPFDPDLSNEQL